MTWLEVKICGVKTAEIAGRAADAGADMLGLVFFERSPRHVTPAAAKAIAKALPGAAFPALVGLFVDPSDRDVERVASVLDWAQLHGAETPAHAASVKKKFGLKVMKAVGVSGPEDVARAADYDVDRILFDARPPKDADRPGGLGAVFDWAALEAYDGHAPFMLSGGLTPENVGEAVAAARGVKGFCGVDVSSGVERAVGEKDPARIAAFIRAARAAIS